MTLLTAIVGCLEYLRALPPAAMVAPEEPLAEEKCDKVARAIAKAAEAESTTREPTRDGSTRFGNAEPGEANQAAKEQLVALQHKALASAVDGGVPVSDDALALRLLQGGSYTSSRAKRLLDLARASYSRSATYDGQSWHRIDVSGAESMYNMRVIGKVLSDSERNSVKPPPPVNAAVVVEVCFRGSVFVGEEDGFNLDNWSRVNLNPGLSKGKAGWLPELTPLDRQIGEASLLDNVQCHVHAGFQNAYIAARGPVMKWLDEQRRQRPKERLHISCCGHSLGAALATLLALDLGSIGHDSVELVTWASPRVGDKAFCDAFAKHVHDVARFTCGADVVPRLPPEKLGFEHVCPEMRLDAWVTSAMSVVKAAAAAATAAAAAAAAAGASVSSHNIDVYAINLENCFRDPLAVVRTSDGGWRLTNSYSSIALASIYVGTGVDILPTVAGWLFANDKVLKKLDSVQDQHQLQLKALQDSVDSVSGCLLRSLQEQDIKRMIRQLRSEVNALMEGAKMRGDDLDFQRLRVSQHNLLDVGKEIWSARDARSKHGPLMLDLLITSYSTELELLPRASRLEDVEERARQIDQLVRSIFPAIAATMSGSFSRLECPALDCLLPQLLIGPVPPLPRDREATDAFWEKVGSSEEQVRRSTSLSWRCKRLVAGDARIVAYLLASPVTEVLKTLNLVNNKIGDEGAAAIAKALRGNKVLTDLNLRLNNIGDKGAAALGKALEVNGVLTNLDLWNNNIGDEGATALASALRVNAVLKTLDLYANNIRVEGAAAIAQALRGNGVLKSIDLSWNNLGDQGKNAIQDAARERVAVPAPAA